MHLSAEPEALIGREAINDVVYNIDEIHRPLPDDEVSVTLDYWLAHFGSITQSTIETGAKPLRLKSFQYTLAPMPLTPSPS